MRAAKWWRPGFVDIHTHYDVQAFWDPTLSPSSCHGVTTRDGRQLRLQHRAAQWDAADSLSHSMLARVEGMPLESLKAGAPWDWRSFGDISWTSSKERCRSTPVSSWAIPPCAVMSWASVRSARERRRGYRENEVAAASIAARRRSGIFLDDLRQPQRCRRQSRSVATRERRGTARAGPACCAISRNGLEFLPNVRLPSTTIRSSA